MGKGLGLKVVTVVNRSELSRGRGTGAGQTTVEVERS